MSAQKSSMQSKLPLTAARVFVAAAQSGSFRDAASLLGLSPSAISRHVKRLENWLGEPLFERGVRHVRLLPAGQDLATQLSDAFQQIETVLQPLARTDPQHIRLTALPFFVSHWLLDQLEDLPTSISLSIDTSQQMMDLDRHKFDVALRNLHKPPVGLWNIKLLDLRLVPVCSSTMARTLRAPADLLDVPLIHLTARPGGWQRWFEKHNLSLPDKPPSLELDTLPAVLEAAASGQGVALGLSPIIWAKPDAHKLCVPFPSQPVEAGSYYLVMRQEDTVRPALKLFSQWIKQRLLTQRNTMLQREAAAIRNAPNR
ncbi:MAG: LysR substrate-binding domain-containing protein [Pseudomonadota bacterium]